MDKKRQSRKITRRYRKPSKKRNECQKQKTDHKNKKRNNNEGSKKEDVKPGNYKPEPQGREGWLKCSGQEVWKEKD